MKGANHGEHNPDMTNDFAIAAIGIVNFKEINDRRISAAAANARNHGILYVPLIESSCTPDKIDALAKVVEYKLNAAKINVVNSKLVTLPVAPTTSTANVPRALQGTQALEIKIDNKWTEHTKYFANTKRLHDTIAQTVGNILHGIKEAAKLNDCG